MSRMVTALLPDRPVDSLDAYVALGGGRGLEVARRLGPDGVIDEVEISGVRGRGGAGFPAGLKWRSIRAGGESAGDRFVVANAAEGEPATFKDRWLMRQNPYLPLEGLLIAAHAVGAGRAFVAMKASFAAEADRVQAALTEIAAAGWVDELQIDLVLGPDEYLFGEEKGLLEVIEGEDPLPRHLPPYVYGLFTTGPQLGWSAGPGSAEQAANPTLVNNLETLASVPAIVTEGGEAFRRLGTPESPGTVLCTVSGDTVRHGVGEFEMGTPLREVIDVVGGGVPEDRSVKYVLSGVANPVLTAHGLDTPVSYEGFEAAGSGLGAAGFWVLDDRTDPVELATAVSRFLSVESCGQCPACKLGTTAVTDLLQTSIDSHELDLSLVAARLSSVDDAARCYLPTQAQRTVGSLLADLRRPGARDGVERRDLLVATLVDLDGDHFTVDERHRRKQPDWTYA
jgi:NADH-quinone oxidoreductase subunit F